MHALDITYSAAAVNAKEESTARVPVFQVQLRVIEQSFKARDLLNRKDLRSDSLRLLGLYEPSEAHSPRAENLAGVSITANPNHMCSKPYSLSESIHCARLGMAGFQVLHVLIRHSSERERASLFLPNNSRKDCMPSVGLKPAIEKPTKETDGSKLKEVPLFERPLPRRCSKLNI